MFEELACPGSRDRIVSVLVAFQKGRHDPEDYNDETAPYSVVITENPVAQPGDRVPGRWLPVAGMYPAVTGRVISDGLLVLLYDAQEEKPNKHHGGKLEVIDQGKLNESRLQTVPVGE